MPEPQVYDYVRYLAAKAAIDDRSLSPLVIEAMRRQLLLFPEGRPLSVVELGAGVGSTFRRLYQGGIVRSGVYRMVDLDQRSLDEATRVAETVVGREDRNSLRVEVHASDAIAYLCDEDAMLHGVDLIIAQALVDLLNVPMFIKAVAERLSAGGLLYTPITFDGDTIFEPVIESERDARIIAAYHRTMDARRTRDGLRTGGSAAGRAMLTELRLAGLEIIEAAASDWVVFPRGGSYSADESYFLHHIVNTVWEALREDADVGGVGLAAWIAERHGQIERGELIYIAHQLDALARKP